MYPESLIHWCSQEAASPDPHPPILTPMLKAPVHWNYQTQQQHGSGYSTGKPANFCVHPAASFLIPLSKEVFQQQSPSYSGHSKSEPSLKVKESMGSRGGLSAYLDAHRTLARA